MEKDIYGKQVGLVLEAYIDTIDMECELRDIGAVALPDFTYIHPDSCVSKSCGLYKVKIEAIEYIPADKIKTILSETKKNNNFIYGTDLDRFDVMALLKGLQPLPDVYAQSEAIKDLVLSQGSGIYRRFVWSSSLSKHSIHELLDLYSKSKKIIRGME